MNTENLGLVLTDQSETSMSFLEWRSMINGVSENSNMQLIDKAIGQINNTIRGSMVKREVTIPSTGWTSGGDEDIPDGVLHIDLEQEDVTEDVVPFIILSPAGAPEAMKCGMSTGVKSLSGCVRIYSAEEPKTEIAATLLLFCASGGLAGGGTSGGGGGSGNSYTLPIATKTRLGGVKIGDGVSVTSDGTISTDTDITDVKIIDGGNAGGN